MLIKDLSKELAAGEMTAVHGGNGDRGNADVLGITQLLALTAPNTVVAGPGSAVNSFNNVSADLDATQETNQNNGDSLALFLGFAGKLIG